MVRKFWNVYKHSKTTKLPRFWQEAFEAAYKHLATDVAGSRDAAISEIARMSLVFVDVEPSFLEEVGSLKRAFWQEEQCLVASRHKRKVLVSQPVKNHWVNVIVPGINASDITVELGEDKENEILGNIPLEGMLKAEVLNAQVAHAAT
ncbi:gamma-aminobutyric acid receptor alpha-like protein [Tanacetum coccineum]